MFVLAPFLPNYNGAYSFNSLQRIVNNAPVSVAITGGNPLLLFPENDQYYFIQDDFKIRSNLTLNLGMRYEYTGQPINILHDQTVLRENGPNGFYVKTLPLATRTVPLAPLDKNNWAPRIGFAWSPKMWKSLLGEDATVIRGGFSIAYDAAYYNILLNVQNAAPFSAALNIAPGSLPATGSPAPLPFNPTGDVVRAAATASGVLPLGKLDPTYLSQTKVATDFHPPSICRKCAIHERSEDTRGAETSVLSMTTRGRLEMLNGQRPGGNSQVNAVTFFVEIRTAVSRSSSSASNRALFQCWPNPSKVTQYILG